MVSTYGRTTTRATSELSVLLDRRLLYPLAAPVALSCLLSPHLLDTHSFLYYPGTSTRLHLFCTYLLHLLIHTHTPSRISSHRVSYTHHNPENERRRNAHQETRLRGPGRERGTVTGLVEAQFRQPPQETDRRLRVPSRDALAPVLAQGLAQETTPRGRGEWPAAAGCQEIVLGEPERAGRRVYG